MKKFMSIILTFLGVSGTAPAQQVSLWHKIETSLTSSKSYENPLYQASLTITLTSPAGKTRAIEGFWDGGNSWKFRFAPDEPGTWQWVSSCTDKDNSGLNDQKGSFTCVKSQEKEAIYRRGPLMHQKGTYHLAYNDGTPFFWTACTAWNGALKSTEEEWKMYLQQRKDNHYNVIQLVATQWRGADANTEGEVAFTGSGQISINPDFFKRMDRKIDQVNEYGLIASPVLLWALPVGEGRHLSPGYYLADNEAILLAKYIVARYQGNQVVWTLGGDGKYLNELEDRWKYIGRKVFENDPPGLVTHHPMGRHWIGDAYGTEDWMDIVGYQSSHSNEKGTVNWINYEPVASNWKNIPPKPIINLEPNYEEIGFRITAEDVRNASYWSLMATPVSGITYGANGIWPWIREGETILNHRHQPGVSTWEKSMGFPGSLQIGYLNQFFSQFEWWNLRPAPELLMNQPGDQQFNRFIGVLQSLDQNTILAYVPKSDPVEIYNPMDIEYQARWFDPVNNKYQPAELKQGIGKIRAVPPGSQDYLLVLTRKVK